MYQLITSAPIRWPQMAKHGIEVSKEARDLITKVSKRVSSNHAVQIQICNCVVIK